MRRRHLLVIVGLIALATLGPARPASAHAELSTSDPADGSVVDTAPRTITLRFSETVTVRPDGVRVLDDDAGRMDAGTARAEGATVQVPIEGVLAPGAYLVAWRAVSDDGHPVRGAFTFSVGSRAEVRAGLADEAFAGSTDRRDEVTAAVLRALSYLGILGATGLVLVGTALRRDDDPVPVGRFTATVVAVGLVAVVAQIPVQASLATGRGLGSITEAGVLSLVLADGVGWSLGLVAAGLVAMLVTSGLPYEGATKLLAIGGSVLAPIGLVVTGHTRTMSPEVVAYAADSAHVLAGAVWFGGLAALIFAVRRRRATDDVTGATEAVARFSGWAAVSAGAVVVAGTVMGWIEVGGLHALTSTTYGRLLMAKVALVGLVLAGAAWNRFRLVPDLLGVDGDPARSAARTATWHTFGRVVRFEIAALVVVLAVTSVLTNVTPAVAQAEGGIQTASARIGDGSVEMIVDPARPGRNDVHLYLLDADGAPDDRYDSATIEFSLPAADIGPLDREPVRAGPGHFQVIGTDLALDGEWTLTIKVEPDRFTEETATLEFRIG